MLPPNFYKKKIPPHDDADRGQDKPCLSHESLGRKQSADESRGLRSDPKQQYLAPPTRTDTKFREFAPRVKPGQSNPSRPCTKAQPLLSPPPPLLLRNRTCTQAQSLLSPPSPLLPSRACTQERSLLSPPPLLLLPSRTCTKEKALLAPPPPLPMDATHGPSRCI